MASTTSLIIGVFTRESQAMTAVDALRSAGFGYDQVGVAAHERGLTPGTLRSDLTNLGVPQEQASYYDTELQTGRTIVSVRPDGRDQEAVNILRQSGGYDYGTQSSAAAQTTTSASTAAAQTNTAASGAAYSNATNNAADTGERVLRLREEVLNVNKMRVQAGEVRLHKEVVEEQKTVNVPVTHEEVVIERRPVTGAPVDNTPIGQDETIRIPVSEEQVTVTKTPVVTGEVAIGKQAVQETQQVTDTVRREEARVDRQGDVDIQGNNVTNNDVTNR